MYIGDIVAIVNHIGNIQLSFNEAAGLAIGVELKIRLMAELYQPLQKELKNVIKQDEAKKGYKIKNKNYWNCDLEYLESAIILIFNNKLDQQEIAKFEAFRQLRNKFLHADFVSFMKLLGVTPQGKKLIQDGYKDILKKSDIKEAVLSLDNKLCRKFQIMGNEVIEILDKLIYSLAKN
ncbi:MAG: hypothetical protein P4L22_05815 [Candidatus Babeliales bacterium]|nr:hypothetical protein [Candidatus Babeliales bacterium]